MDIKCKCGSTQLGIRQDKRGLPEFFCTDCKSYIKKAGATEVLEFFETTRPLQMEAPKEKEQEPCPHCFDVYTRLGGRCLQINERFRQKYCPECGRKLKDYELV